MKFFIKSDKFIGFFKNPSQIQIGDIIYADALKYSDKELKNFIGYSYADYFVVASDKIAENTFKVKATSQRVLEFDGEGVITVSGTSEQILTLDKSGVITDSKVLKNNLAITGGTGKFVNTTGKYDIETIENMTHVGKIYFNDQEDVMIILHIIILIVFIFLFIFAFYKK